MRSESGSRLIGTFTRQGLRVHLRIVDRDVQVEVSEVAPREALGHQRHVGLRVARPGINHAQPFRPLVSTTSASPSHRPTE